MKKCTLFLLLEIVESVVYLRPDNAGVEASVAKFDVVKAVAEALVSGDTFRGQRSKCGRLSAVLVIGGMVHGMFLVRLVLVAFENKLRAFRWVRISEFFPRRKSSSSSPKPNDFCLGQAFGH